MTWQIVDCKILAMFRYPPDNDEKKEKLGKFFEKYPPPKIAGHLPGYVKALKEKNSSISKFGILGVRFTPSCAYHK